LEAIKQAGNLTGLLDERRHGRNALMAAVGETERGAPGT